MSLTKEELENLSSLLLSTNDDNTAIAFAILSGQEEPVQELLTDVFVVYKLTEYEDLREQAMLFLEQFGLNEKSPIIQAGIQLKMTNSVTEQQIQKRISTYVLASEGLLDGVKLAIALFKKYKIGLAYILEKASLEQQQFFLNYFVRGTSFSMTGLNLTKIPEALYTFEHLTSIDLSNNNLVFIPSKIEVFKKLSKLNLAKNKIKKLPKIITSFKYLIDLNISYNQIRTFPTQVLEMKQLKCLNLVKIHDDITYKMEVPDEFQLLPNLKEIHMFDNYLKGNFINYPIFSTFSQEEPINLNRLALAEHLYVQKQKKEGVSYLFKHSQDDKLIHEILQNLFLNKNQREFEITSMVLEKLPSQLADYPITKMALDRVNFVHEDDTFKVIKELKELKVLTLTNCNLDKFPEEIKACKKLKKLSFTYNYLQEIPEEISELENLEELDLHGAFQKNISNLLTIPTSYKELKKLQVFKFYESNMSLYYSSSPQKNKNYYHSKFRKVLPKNCKIILD